MVAHIQRYALRLGLFLLRTRENLNATISVLVPFSWLSWTKQFSPVQPQVQRYDFVFGLFSLRFRTRQLLHVQPQIQRYDLVWGLFSL